MFNKGVIKKGFTLVELVVAMTVSTIVLAGVSGILIFFNSFFNKATTENTALTDSLNIKKNIVSFFDEVVVKGNVKIDETINQGEKKVFFSFKDLNDRQVNLFNNKEKKLIEATWLNNEINEKIIASYSSELEISVTTKIDSITNKEIYNNFLISRIVKDGSLTEVINFSYYLD